MGQALTVQDFFKLILFLLGIGALTYLILVFKNINQLLAKLNALLDSNEKVLTKTMGQLPEISENLNLITKTTNKTLNDISPEVTQLVHNVNSISSRVDNITDSIDSTTHNIVETLDIVSDSVSETAYAFQYNVKNIDNYIRLIIEIIETMKNYIKKK